MVGRPVVLLLALLVALLSGCVEEQPIVAAPSTTPTLRLLDVQASASCGYARSTSSCHTVEVHVENPAGAEEAFLDAYLWRGVGPTGALFLAFDVIGPAALAPGGSTDVSITFDVEPPSATLSAVRFGPPGRETQLALPTYPVAPALPAITETSAVQPLVLRLVEAKTGAPCFPGRVCESIVVDVHNPAKNPELMMGYGAWSGLDAKGGVYTADFVDAPDALAPGGNATVRLWFDIEDAATHLAIVRVTAGGVESRMDLPQYA